MSSVFDKYNYNASYQQGFTLIEVLIAVAIIGIIAAIAVPSYERYVKDTKRTDMMAELVKMSTNIESRSLANGNYRSIQIEDLYTENMSQNGQYPSYSPIYSLQISPNRTEVVTVGSQTKSVLLLDGSNWSITATPITGEQMDGDGNLSIDYTGKKCHETKCSLGNEWK